MLANTKIDSCYYELNTADLDSLEQLCLSEARLKVSYEEIAGAVYMHVTFWDSEREQNGDMKSFLLCEQKKEIAKLDAQLLMKEYEGIHRLSEHWDKLRWQIAATLITLHTAAVAGAGYATTLLLGSSVNPTLDFFLWNTLLIFSIVGVFICVVWCVRVMGIHDWQKKAITRQRIIELDPRTRGVLRHLTMMTATKHSTERRGRVHSTGNLESTVPPALFAIIWGSLATSVLLQPTWHDELLKVIHSINVNALYFISPIIVWYLFQLYVVHRNG
jgi:hypothetical protein